MFDQNFQSTEKDVEVSHSPTAGIMVKKCAGDSHNLCLSLQYTRFFRKRQEPQKFYKFKLSRLTKIVAFNKLLLSMK